METVEERIFWETFLDLVAKGRVVPIIGRDLLTVQYQGTKVSLLSLLAQRLAESLQVSKEGLPEGDELHTVACRYMKGGNSIEDVYPVIKMVMPGEGELPIPPAFSKLAAIPTFKLFVTTTFDSLLERAINQERFAGAAKTLVLTYTPNDVEDMPAPLEKMDQPVVFHLLGKLSAAPVYAVTQEDILEFLLALKSEQPKVLFDVLRNASLLILGCSFGDWLARFFIRTAKCQRLSKGGPDFVADKRISGDNNLLIFFKDFSGARTKIYPAGGALEFVDELHRRWTERYPDGSATPPKGEDMTAASYVRPGAVFLSYASEDRTAAGRIKEALEAAGVEVFFDKDDLKAGEDWEVKLKRSIEVASLFIPVISKNTLTQQRRFFRIEWKQALEEAMKAAETQIFIVPVVIDETPPDEEAFPAKFRKANWETLPEGQINERFVDQIKQLYRRHQKMVMGAL
jgi:hypothetical protein